MSIEYDIEAVIGEGGIVIISCIIEQEVEYKYVE